MHSFHGPVSGSGLLYTFAPLGVLACLVGFEVGDTVDGLCEGLGVGSLLGLGVTGDADGAVVTGRAVGASVGESSRTRCSGIVSLSVIAGFTIV